MKEHELQDAVQSLIRALPDYDDENVTINDWSRLDAGLMSSPVAIVGTGDRFTATPRATEYGVAVILVEPFEGWAPTLSSLAKHREEVANQLLNEVVGLNSTTFEALDDVGVYPVGADLDNPPFLVQSFELTCIQGAL